MDKTSLIVVSLCAMGLLILGSLSNVVGYQSVQPSHQQTIKETVNQRELLFQTIIDIANNKEIQRIILKSQMSPSIFPVSDVPVITKNQLRQMYLLGVLLPRFISISRMQSIVEKYRFSNQEMQKEINVVFEKDATLTGEITQLRNSECDCDDAKTTEWDFPVICWVLLGLCIGIFGTLLYLYRYFHMVSLITLMDIWTKIMISIGLIWNCDWAQ